MPLDPNECLENAMRCRKLATETTDPGVQEILIEVRRDRLASKLADTHELLPQSVDQESGIESEGEDTLCSEARPRPPGNRRLSRNVFLSWS